jgi:hypothetical protein
MAVDHVSDEMERAADDEGAERDHDAVSPQQGKEERGADAELERPGVV